MVLIILGNYSRSSSVRIKVWNDFLADTRSKGSRGLVSVSLTQVSSCHTCALSHTVNFAGVKGERVPRSRCFSKAPDGALLF